MGNWTALGSLDGGLANVTSRRSIALPGLGATALGEQHVTFGSVRGQVAYTQPMGIIYVKPMLDVAATYTNLDGYHERGAGALDLIVAGADTWIYSATPAVEVGAQYRTVGGGLIRPYLRAGVSFLSDPTTVTSAAFEGAPGANPMQINGKADKTYAEVGAGLVMFPRSGVSMKLNYDGRFSESTESHSGSAKVGINF